jgi:hypothetical protein
MDENNGFRLLWTKEMSELQGVVKLYQYIHNGAELLSIENNDENKVFGITFRTPPKDSTGVAHILEHSVLCGSRKYPVKEPFVELLKGSMQTFLNAMTFPDKTCYPLASQNLQDFYNLIDVYLDAVFYPRITPDIFAQEGWHLELAEERNGHSLKGVVYNEMKGNYSSPNSLLYEYSQQSLFPDSSYGLDSGGHPEHIPELSYERFKAFHRKYYHPSNARIFFYGDDDPQERLRIVSQYLQDFDPIEIDSDVGLQPRFTKPRDMTEYFVSDEGRNDKAMVTLNWLLDVTTNVEFNLACQILDTLLVDMPGSPLRKALIESGLGEDLAGGGLENELYQMFYSIGMKGVKIDKIQQVQDLIQQTLEDLADKGFDQRTLEAAVNSVEFALRENNTGTMPRGLIYMLRALTTWLYNSDPTLLLAYEEPLKHLKARIQAGEPVFKHILRTFFLENQHRTSVVLLPDPGLQKKIEQKEQNTVHELFNTLSASEQEELRAKNIELHQKQETPDRPEDLAKIPFLQLKDLPREVQTIPCEVSSFHKGTVLYHDLFSQGVFYCDLCFDLSRVPQDYLGYVPLLGRALVEMGTEEEDYVSLSQRIQAKTGGIHAETFTSAHDVESQDSTWFIVRGKTMQDKVQDLLDILRDILLKGDLSDPDRFRQILLEEKARYEQRLIPSGHQMVNRRIRGKFTLSDWVNEQMNGLDYLLFLRRLEEMIEANKWSSVLKDMETLKNILLKRASMVANVTIDADNWKLIEPHFSSFLNQLPPTETCEKEIWQPGTKSLHEAMTLPAQVNYVGKGINLYEQGYRFSGSSLVVNRYLRTTWLWDQVRVRGGAYGAFSLFDRLTGVLTFVSYRDPNLAGTLDVFDRTAEFLQQLEIEDQELEKAIIGTIGDLDTYLLPDAKGFVSMIRYLIGETDEKRQRRRDAIFHTSKQDFQDFGRWLAEVKDKGLVSVLGSETSISSARAQGIAFDSVWNVL